MFDRCTFPNYIIFETSEEWTEPWLQQHEFNGYDMILASIELDDPVCFKNWTFV